MSIKVKRRYKKLNEDDQQNNQAQQPAAPATPAAAPQTQQNPGQQPANNQAQQGNAQQTDMNAAVNNINKFVGETFKTIVDGVKANFEKACPEVIAISKDQNSPLKDPVKKLEEVYGQLKKAQVDPTKPETVAQAITSYNDFITALTNFATEIAKQSEQQNNQQQQPNQQQNNQQVPQNNNQQQAAPAAPAQLQNNNQAPTPDAQQQNNVNASYDYNGFGKALHEKLKMKAYERNMWRQR